MPPLRDSRSTDQICVTRDFISGEELEFWSSHLSNVNFWTPVIYGVIDGQPDHYTVDDEYMNEQHLNFKFRKLAKRMCKVVEHEHGDDFLTSAYVSFRRFVPGTNIGTHDDHLVEGKFDFSTRGKSENDPTQNDPLAAAYIDVSSILYYNNEYEGGELFFPHLGIEIKPEPGMLITFPSTRGYEHGVRDVVSGERWISAMHWTRTKTMAIAILGGLVPENWHTRYLDSAKVTIPLP